MKLPNNAPMRLEGNYEHDKNAIEIKTKGGRQRERERERGKKEKKKVRFSQLVKKVAKKVI
jgi:hypothetical protein